MQIVRLKVLLLIAVLCAGSFVLMSGKNKDAPSDCCSTSDTVYLSFGINEGFYEEQTGYEDAFAYIDEDDDLANMSLIYEVKGDYNPKLNFRREKAPYGEDFIIEGSDQMEMFSSFEQATLLRQDELKSLRIITISELKKKERQFSDCIEQRAEEHQSQSILPPSREEIFKTVFLVYRENDKLFKQRVVWNDIEY